MKPFPTLLLLALPWVLASQHQSYLSLGGGPYITDRFVDTGNKMFDDGLNHFYQSALCWTVTVAYERRLFHRFFIKTGLQMASSGYRRRWLEYDHSQDAGSVYWINPSREPNDITRYRGEITYLHSGIPVIARFELTDKKITPFVETGVIPSQHLQTRWKQITNLGTDVMSLSGGNDMVVKRFQVVGYLSAGCSIRLGDQLQIYGQPVFRYHLTPQIVIDGFKERLYGAGIDVGIRRHI